MLRWCMQIKIKYVIPLIISLFVTYWIFGISAYELVPQWHISLSTSRFYPFHLRKVDKELKFYAVGDDNHFYHYIVQLKRRRRLEILPEILPMHDLSLPSEIKKVKAFDIREINGMQCIVFLSENSTVFAVNDHFEVIWKSHVFSKSEGFSNVVETGFVRFSDTCISPTKCNVVFVGASLRRSQEDGKPTGHGHHDGSSEKHLSTVAFEAKSGELLWRHFPYDFGRGLEEEGDRLAPSIRHHWKLKILRSHLRMEHIDERPWVTYLPFFLNLLPHSWVQPYDTDAIQTSLRHHRVESYDSADQKDLTRESGRANVIVVRHEKGLEVLDLFTGKPRSHLEMEGGQGKTFFREASRLLLASLETSANHSAGILCSLSVIQRAASGPVSTHSQHRWTDVCAPVGLLGTARPSHANYREDPAKVVAPVVSERYRVWPSALRIFGFGLSNRSVKDIIALVSDGTLSSYSIEGTTNWRVNVPVSWLSISRDLASGDISHDNSIRKRYERLFIPSLSRLRAADSSWMMEAVVAAGWDSVAIVDVETGATAATHDLPCQPIYRPLVMDDHLVIVCDSMVIGFYMNVPLRIGTFIMAFTGFALILIMGVCCIDPNSIFWELVD